MESQVLTIQLWVVLVAGFGLAGSAVGFIFMFWRVIVKIGSNEKTILGKIKGNREISTTQTEYLKEMIGKIDSRVHELEEFRIRANQEFVTHFACNNVRNNAKNGV